jgi:hypothetical protein
MSSLEMDNMDEEEALLAKWADRRTTISCNHPITLSLGVFCVAIVLLGTTLGWSSLRPSNSSSSKSLQNDHPGPDVVSSPDRFMNISRHIGILLGQDPAIFSRNSSQHAALEWLAYHDQIGWDLLDDDSIKERYALAVFFFSVSTQASDSWLEREFHFMDTKKSICEWNANQDLRGSLDRGITCFGASGGRASPTFLSICMSPCPAPCSMTSYVCNLSHRYYDFQIMLDLVEFKGRFPLKWDFSQI